MIAMNIIAVITILPVVSRAFNKKKYQVFEDKTANAQNN
jgi:hypothetical protein